MEEETPLAPLPDESPPAHEAFRAYAEMGATRSTVRVAHEVGKSTRLIEGWCSRYRWVERAQAFDTYLAQHASDAYASVAEEMAARHAREAMALQEQALAKLRALDPSTLTPREATRLYEMAVQVERLARGEPTQHTRSDVSAQMRQQTPQEELSGFQDSLADVLCRSPEAREAMSLLFDALIDDARASGAADRDGTA
jgi:hypothetical protein